MAVVRARHLLIAALTPPVPSVETLSVLMSLDEEVRALGHPDALDELLARRRQALARFEVLVEQLKTERQD